jgi:hypothetical protein
MADTLTTNYSLTKPEVGASQGTWGTKLNDDLDDIDTQMQANEDAAAAAQATADAALPKVGGVMTGRVDLFSSQAVRTALGSISGAQALNLALGNGFTATIGGVTTFSVSNVPAGTFFVGLVLLLTNGGSSGVIWPASFRWPAGAQPDLTVSGVDLIAAVSFDNGTTWYAAAALNVA